MKSMGAHHSAWLTVEHIEFGTDAYQSPLANPEAGDAMGHCDLIVIHKHRKRRVEESVSETVHMPSHPTISPARPDRLALE